MVDGVGTGVFVVPGGSGDLVSVGDDDGTAVLVGVSVGVSVGGDGRSVELAVAVGERESGVSEGTLAKGVSESLS
jgi:hypothetical protein